MPRLLAFLVEDDPEQMPEARETLEELGFDVKHYWDASSAIRGLADLQGQGDLLILDRRLPVTVGEEPTNEIGDDLLSTLVQTYPDLPTAVFTGFTDTEHMQLATRKRGTISLRNGAIQIDRVTPFKKSQTLEFEGFVGEVREQILEVAGIEVLPDTGTVLSEMDKRLLRRVCFEYSGTSIRARSLEGGASTADVWYCEISSNERRVAEIVVKRSKKPPQPGGFQSLLPASLAAGTVDSISGLCRGQRAAVLQTAGKDAGSLASLIVSDEQAANLVVGRVIEALDGMHSGPANPRTIEQVCLAFRDWGHIVATLEANRLPIPSSNLHMTSKFSAQHGDLHAGNILVLGSDPVLIDFDSQTDGSRLVDAVALCYGSLFHRSSPLRDCEWPKPQNFADLTIETFLEGCPWPDFFRTCAQWVESRKTTEREFLTVLLAFAARQLEYPDVEESPRLLETAKALARICSQRLIDD